MLNQTCWLIRIGKFDVTDPSFSTEVLRLAPFCPVLLYSLLALSAVHMNRVSSYDVNEAEEYHEKCVELLIPMLDDEQVITDGAVLASSVLLRFYEEMSGKLATGLAIRTYPSTSLTHLKLSSHPWTRLCMALAGRRCLRRRHAEGKPAVGGSP